MTPIMSLIKVVLMINILLIKINSEIIVFNRKFPTQIETQFLDMPALFGGTIPFTGIQAMIVYANSSEACDTISSPPNTTINFTGKWAVLIKRYGCLFEKKIRNAQNASYHIAIVHNVNSSELKSMTADNSQDIYIPSIFVNQETGKLIKNSYQWTNGYFVVIDSSTPNSLTERYLPSIIIGGISVFTLVCLISLKCMLYHRRRDNTNRLPVLNLEKIPIAKFQKGDPNDNCVICMENYIVGEKLRVLPCSHAYHSKCVDAWLTRSNRICPICKFNVLP